MATTEEMLEKLEERFIYGEISEEVYKELKQKLESKLSAHSGSTSSSQNSSTVNHENNSMSGDSSGEHASSPDFSDMYMSGNPDAAGSQNAGEYSAGNSSSGSGSKSGSGWQANAGIRLQPGDELGSQYVIRKFLSQGGFGSVYRAYDSLREKDVALKVIFPELNKIDSALRQLINEYDSRSRISNRHHILEVSTPQRISFKNLEVIVLPMELASGGNLREYLTGISEDTTDEDREKQLLDYFKQACSGVKAIHDSGLTHQDIKPDNLLICTDLESGKNIVKVAGPYPKT